jgi:sulfide:quinone oxidoreductase
VARAEARVKVEYDYLINATGPRLRFDRTPGLGPDFNSHSVCTEDHAVHAARALDESVARMKKGERQQFVIGVGHGTCTCEGAAFEYIVNLEFELRARGVRDKADIKWLTNEYELGDFGMGGMNFRSGGYVTPSSAFNASIFAERGIDWVTRAHTREVEKGRVHYETVDGTAGRAAVRLRDATAAVQRGGDHRARPRRGRHHAATLPAQ